MRNLYAATVIIGLFAVVGGGWTVARYLRNERSERVHFERQETELIIINLANAPLRLFRAGKSLSAGAIQDFNGSRAWLPRGNYFLQADLPGRQPVFYPVPISGFRQGPDAGGSLAVTIRSQPPGLPPSPFANLPEWVFIPGGSFLIGDRQNPRETHYIWLPAFYMSAFEVTNVEFREFMRDPEGYSDEANWTESGRKWKTETRSQATSLLSASDAEFVRFGREDQPVTWVTWYEAEAYCKWMTRNLEASRWLVSLPSEAEWEKAARGPDSFDFALSSQLSDDESKLYNWRKNPGAPETVIGIEATKARFTPNRYGIFHLSGNVVEWTQTINRPYNREVPYEDGDGRNRDDLTDVRVVRGGSWYSASITLLSIAYRDTFQPEVRNHDLGFRIVAKALP